MKKIFKMTLFKKTFFIIFAGLLCLEGIRMIVDIENEISNLITRRVSYYNDIYHQLNEISYENRNTGLSKDEAIELLYETFKEKSNGYFSIITTNLDANEVPLYEFTIPYFMNNPSIRMTASYELDLSLFSTNEIQRIEEYVRIQDEQIKTKYQCKNYEYEKDQVTYLSFNDEIEIGVKKEDIEVLEDTLHSFFGYEIYYDSYFYTDGNIHQRMMLKDEVSAKYRKASIETYDEYNRNGDVRIGYKRDGNDLYISAKSLINIGINHYYLNFAEIHEGAFNNVLQQYITSKGVVYNIGVVMSFIMSLLVSYMVTFRVKKVHRTSMLIGEGCFDVKLKDKSKDEIGDLSRVINTMCDKLKTTVNQLNQEIDHVKELESLRKDFINQFTHEMKTPLGIINGYSELIELTEDEEEKQRYLMFINHETERINELVLSMLKLSRLEAGKVELHKEEIDLEYLTVQVVDEFEVLLKQKNIKIIINCNNRYVYGDKEQLKTVIRNFISNAIKHTDTKIIVSIDKGVRVYNEGKTIEEDKLSSIWYTFVTHDKTGTGLGLAICRSILELHEYKYGVVNKDNGVEFYFYE